jgi:7,8-dihydropterin-6-yl-methyl-4-(beta-D-ribofuranosyl)aminobenzene 5'-phosphate synthase
VRAGVAGASLSAPRAVTGSATDPIRLEPVDELRVTTLVDNVFDALLAGEERARRIRSALSPLARRNSKAA